MEQFYLGGDVSKGYCDFVILDSTKEPMMKNFQLDDTFEGHSRLYAVLCQFLESHPEARLNAAVESTGGYEKNWHEALVRFQTTLPIQAARLNPVGVYHNSKADLKRNSTDEISAQNIAEYLIAHPEKVLYQQHDPLASSRKQWRFIKLLTKQSTQVLNHIEALVYSANPELLTYCKQGVPLWILKVLEKYPTASRLANAKGTAVAKIPYVTKARALKLIHRAKKSTASDTDAISGQVIQATVKQLLHLKDTIASQTEQMKKNCSVPEVALLKTFIGIADLSAIGLLLEIQSVERFETVKKLAAFFGIHPVYKQSGDGKGSFKMCKKGRGEPRRILFMVALNSVRTNPLIREVYTRHIAKGKCRMAALGVCMHKILRIVYGMLKNNNPFDPDIDRQNQKKERRSPLPDPQKKTRRFQGYDETAPISKRQARTRMEREESQSGNTTTSGITPPLQDSYASTNS